MDAASVRLTRPREVRAYLQAVGFRPGKSLGQNFLVDAHMRDLILDASETGAGDRVIEVGPGLGVMTEGLLERAGRVVAIELDHRLVAHLRERFASRSHLDLRQGDATETDWDAECRPDPVRVVSNLPYSVGSRILYDLADPRRAPLSVTVMVQRDVADRLLAGPGEEAYGLLSVRMGWTFHLSRVRNVPGGCFFPPPRVDSTVVHCRRRSAPPAEVEDVDRLERLVKFAFTRRRKQIGRILKEFGMSTDQLPIEARRRPETLSLEEWAVLAGLVPCIRRRERTPLKNPPHRS